MNRYIAETNSLLHALGQLLGQGAERMQRGEASGHGCGRRHFGVSDQMRGDIDACRKSIKSIERPKAKANTSISSSLHVAERG